MTMTTDGAIERLRQAAADLQTLLIDQSLCAEYQNRKAPLDEEDRQLEGERQTLSDSQSTLRPVTEAKVRVLERLADERTAQGDLAGAEAKRKESSAVQQQFSGIGVRLEQIDARRKEIGAAKNHIARQLFAEVYPSLPAATFAAIEAALDVFDAIKDGMLRFESECGIQGLVSRPALEKLLPSTMPGSNRFLAMRMQKRFR